MISLMQALQRIKKHCRENECQECIFSEKHSIDENPYPFPACELITVSPCNWKINWELADAEEAINELP